MKLSLGLTLTLTPNPDSNSNPNPNSNAKLNPYPNPNLNPNPNQIKFKFKFRVGQWRNEDGEAIGTKAPSGSFSRGGTFGHQCPENVDVDINSFSCC